MIKAFLCDLMNKVTYLAIIEKTKDGFSAYFPDLPGCISIGDTLEKCIDNVNDTLNLHYYGMQKNKESIPVPSDYDHLSKEEMQGNIVCPITIYPDRYKRQMEERRIKINCTIPLWLKKEGEKAGLNFSKLLEKSVKEQLEL